MKIRSTLSAIAAALLGFSAASASFNVSASTALEVLVEGTVHQSLFAIDFVGEEGLAVGSDGEVQSTTDGGKTWTKSKFPTTMALLGVDLDQERGLVVGQGGVVFHKVPGGVWKQVESGTTKRLFWVESNSKGLAVAVGEFGGVIISEDGGKSWRSLKLNWLEIGTEGGVEPHLYSVFVAEDETITMVGEFGLIMRSTDRGISWTIANKAEASLLAIEIGDDGKGFAVGQDGYALKTADAGQTWRALDIGSKAILNGVHSAANGRVVVSAMREMMVSDDGGETWRALEDEKVTTVWYVGVNSSSNGFLVVGQGGRILKLGS